MVLVSTFLQALAVFFIIVPVFLLWGFALVNLFMRKDMSAGTRVLWLLAIIFVPLFGPVIYLLMWRPPDEFSGEDGI